MPISVYTASVRYCHEAGVGLIELLIALLLFAACVISLTQMQFKSGMESLDNHQRAVALWSARALIDSISANSSQEGISEYESRISAITDCAAYSVKHCEASSTVSEVPSCNATELAAYDVWSTFCEGSGSVSSQLIEYDATLSCDGPCTTNSNMTLRLSWISRLSDSDYRLNALTPEVDSADVSGILDFIALDFRP